MATIEHPEIPTTDPSNPLAGLTPEQEKQVEAAVDKYNVSYGQAAFQLFGIEPPHPDQDKDDDQEYHPHVTGARKPSGHVREYEPRAEYGGPVGAIPEENMPAFLASKAEVHKRALANYALEVSERYLRGEIPAAHARALIQKKKDSQ